ncbi:hypothetical protein ACCC98_12590 [Rhizobium pisi]|uniref:hypothetical protein n=1 Tax=Rhizobium pisi TaxID=574561 RepID=UPI0039B11150
MRRNLALSVVFSLSTLLVFQSDNLARADTMFGLFGSTKWTGFYYPSKHDLTVNTRSPEFDTVDECRSWAAGQRAAMSIPAGADDYECGSNCKPWDNGIYMCDKTIR